jgi:hypothetical protein
MKPKFYIEMVSSYRDGGPIARAIRVITSRSVEHTDELVQNDIEADIAMTNTIEIALRLVKETERTHIVLTYYRRDEKAQADALASRFPERISVVTIIGEIDEPGFVPFLAQLIGEKTKE